MNEMPAPPPNLQDKKNKRIAAGILGIIPITGSLGIHKFILGYTSAGLIMLLTTVLTLGLAGSIVVLIGLIEGILYLTKSDEEFYQTYIKEQRPWF
jgi:TM2 domain-containing membrane protein YozV